MLFIAKYMMLLVAICTNVVLAMDNNLDQDLKDQTNDKFILLGQGRQPKYLYKQQRTPSVSADSLLGLLGKRAAYTMGTDMISGMMPIGKRAPSMTTDMITGMNTIGKRAPSMRTDMISGMMPIGKRAEMINMKPIWYPRSMAYLPQAYSDDCWLDVDSYATSG